MAWARGAALRMSAGRRLAVVAPVVRVVYEAVELDPTRVVRAIVVDFVVAPLLAGIQRVRPVVVASVVMVADKSINKRGNAPACRVVCVLSVM